MMSVLYYNIGEEAKKEYAMPTEYEKMIAGDFYKPSDPELRALAASSREKQCAFNAEPDSRGQRLSNLGLVRLVKMLP